jgi:hypothetical protein
MNRRRDRSLHQVMATDGARRAGSEHSAAVHCAAAGSACDGERAHGRGRARRGREVAEYARELDPWRCMDVRESGA